MFEDIVDAFTCILMGLFLIVFLSCAAAAIVGVLVYVTLTFGGW